MITKPPEGALNFLWRAHLKVVFTKTKRYIITEALLTGTIQVEPDPDHSPLEELVDGTDGQMMEAYFFITFIGFKAPSVPNFLSISSNHKPNHIIPHPVTCALQTYPNTIRRSLFKSRYATD